MVATVIGATVIGGWLLGAVAVVIARRHMGRVRWQRLFHRRPSRITTAWVDRCRRAVARSWRSRGASWWGPVVGSGLGILAGQMMSGPVAAAALGAYGAAVVVVVRRRAQRRAWARACRVSSDTLAALAADLRAGLSQDQALLSAGDTLRLAGAGLLPPASAGALPVARQIACAAAVSQASGAPLADVLDRLDTHLRSIDRANALAETQAAGARASAALLAAMPAAGVGLGAAIGVDPVHVLLHTTPGGMALCSAVALQLGGLAWSARLAHIEVAR